MCPTLPALAIVFIFAQVPSEPRAEYAELSKFIQKIVVKDLPKEFTDASEWGKTIPIPAKLRLPNLRTRVKVGDHEELPHGLWKKSRAWLDDPAEDVTIHVRDLRKLESGKGHRLGLDITVALNAIQDIQHWQKGLATVGASAQARAVVLVALDIDVAVAVNGKKFPPELRVEPSVVDSKLLLKEFDLQRVTPLFGLGTNLEGDKAREIGNELKGAVQALMTARDGELRDRANRAIVQALQEGKGNISAASLFKALSTGDSSKVDPSKSDLEKLQGTWLTVSLINNGKTLVDEKSAPADRPATKLVYQGTKWLIQVGDKTVAEGTFAIDSTKKPKEIDIMDGSRTKNDKTKLGIFELNGDTYRFCLAPEGQPRPTEFTSTAGSGHSLGVSKREKK
jgi:uncharacterized protein (TIGR03067 family)